jgi:hypothetical protein
MASLIDTIPIRKESSARKVQAPLMAHISKEDYTDFPGFSMDFESV